MCSSSAPRGLAEVLATFLGPCRPVVGRRLLATGGLGLWLEMGVSVWRSLRHIDWVPVECISGFSSHTPGSCTN